jgi:hypothetical protein
VAVVLSGCGCGLPLDILGQEQIVKQQDHLQGSDSLVDDRIEDKHPQFDPSLVIEETFRDEGNFSDCPVTLNKSGSVTKVDVIPFPDIDGAALGQTLFPSFTAAAAALGSRPILPSMELVNAALKPFDDGLYAAIELGAEDGSQGSPIAKRTLLTDLLAELLVRSAMGAAAEQPLAREAAASIGAALQLGGGQVPAAVAPDADLLVRRFQADPFQSRPIGFYSWSPALSAIFQQDRLLQSPVSVRPSFGAYAAATVALNGNGPLAARYGQVLRLYAGLTNPFFDRSIADLSSLAPDGPSLGNLSAIQSAFMSAHPETVASDPACAAHLAFVPASDSPEVKLFRTLYCNGALPPNANLLDVLIQAIRSGTIDLAPSGASGWYDRQIYALETLLVPDRADEKDHLFLTHRYKQKLVETFKTLVTETRETHVKQLGTFSVKTSGAAVQPMVDVYPLLPVEPFPTFYLRTARAYVFVQTLLASVLGRPFMTTSHRLLETGGTSTLSLDDELTEKIALLYGLHVLSAASIGMRPGLTPDETTAFPPEADAQRARAWLDGWSSDRDVAKDPRVIVPIEHSDAGDRYWAVIGSAVVKTRAMFYPGFEPKFVSGCAIRSFVAFEPYLLTGRTVEITRPASAPPLTRDEFRALCDRSRTQDAIVKALENP